MKSRRSIKDPSSRKNASDTNGDERTVIATTIVPFSAFRSPGPPAAGALVASDHAARRRQPSRPTAVHPEHQAHWDQDTSTEAGASCARHTEKDLWGSVAVRDAADDAVVARRQKWASYIEAKEGLVGAGAEGSWGSPERSGKGLAADDAGAEPGAGWTRVPGAQRWQTVESLGLRRERCLTHDVSSSHRCGECERLHLHRPPRLPW